MVNPGRKSTQLPFSWVKLVFAVLFVCYASVFLARQINMVNSDLGRHLVNGKLFLETGKVISTNYYSYTEPAFPTINHHWGAGVLFYLVSDNFGFKGLSIFYILAVLSAVLLFIATALNVADWRLVFFVSILSVPLFAARTEVRPEGISLLFVGILFYLLTLFRDDRIRYHLLAFILLVVQLLWVNAHIFFFMGFIMVGFFLMEESFRQKRKTKINQYFVLIVLQTLISLINPSFVEGLLVPLTIFKEYGYTISENQSILYMQEKLSTPLYVHYQMLALVILVLFGWLIWKKKLHEGLVLLMFSVFFGLLGFNAVRAIPLFGLVSIPTLAFLLQLFIAKMDVEVKNKILNSLVVVALFFVLFGVSNGYSRDAKNKRPGATYVEPYYYSPIKYTTGIGLYPGLNSSAEFFIKHNIKGPIFNDYDLGGFLIYYLNDREKVFVDNRPEAYSVEFFNDIYIPMQWDMAKFREIEQKYQFNCIWFFRFEDSPWSKNFLLEISKQSDYTLVFVDDLTVMFLKRNEQNMEVIQQFQLNRNN